MDDLFSYLRTPVHGSTSDVIDPARRRRKANSFRAAWDPAPLTDLAEIPPAYRRGAAAVAVAPAATWRRDGGGSVAVAAPPRRPAPAVALGELAHPVVDVATAVRQRVRIRPSHRAVDRALELLPFALAFALISSLVWGAFWLPIPLVVMLLGFDVYWAWRSLNIGVHTIKGYRAMKAAARIDWRKHYDAERITRTDVLAWDDVRHMVIIPTYKESLDKLRATVGKLAESEVAREKLLVVIAMEEADSGAPGRFEALQREFSHRFLALIGTTHPKDIAGEVRGKSSNEAWAARWAKRLFCDEMGLSLDHLTVTSCDADTLFHPRYFGALTYYFATNPRRYRTFWQGPIFYYNNVWDVPAPLRIQNSLGGINHLAKLVRKYTVLFPQSTYSLSLRMCHEVGYWDVDVVPEDWHMFLKCFFELKGEPDVQPILLPVGNDGVRAHSYMRTFWEHYQQARRHAWGCSDIPYAVRQFIAHPEIPFLRRLRRTWSLTENHVLWSAQWFLITGVAANMSAGNWGAFIGLHPFAQHNIPTWFITASHWILLPCMLPLLLMIVLDMMMRPPRPRRWKPWLYPVQFAQWALMAPITLFFTSLPAIDAQIRLALGRRLEYKVTEKA
ncbi:MAG TPA: glycosyltransferase family 2 protein [Dehalococcoidia bacterium]|nr:glycosyltransferase family 2 protein [Dehalococcoidia bacterium]